MADIEKGTNPESIRWQPPLTNVDGTPVNGPLDYRIYRRDDDQPHTPDDFFFVVVGDLQPNGEYVAPLPSFPNGRNVIAMTAVDAEDDESAFSNTVGFRIASYPNAPVLL